MHAERGGGQGRGSFGRFTGDGGCTIAVHGRSPEPGAQIVCDTDAVGPQRWCHLAVFLV